jgi:predicted DNA-binding protein
MTATKSRNAEARSAEERTEKHRKTHKLVQTWVSPEMKKALDAKAKSEGRTLANYVRRELAKLVGMAE